MAGVDSANQFPNSAMARAIRMGQSQMRTVDSPGRIVLPAQENVSIASAVGLTIPAPSLANNWTVVTYAVVTAVGGPLYVTYDGSTPSITNYAVTVSSGQSLSIQGSAALAAAKLQGTSMSVSYWS
jgi:hypothetical protein